MQIQEGQSLKSMNTFGIDAKAKYLSIIREISDLKTLVKSNLFKEENHLILGGGSNILLTKDYNGLVIKNELKGISLINEDNASVILKIMSGEVWHELVLYCVENNWAGIENLSLIPGSVGAAPMQNIGAYGVELKSVFIELEALHLESGEVHTFDKKACDFGYRQSVFKNRLKEQYFILSITIKLLKKPKLHLNYGAINDTLKLMGKSKPNIKDVSQAVIQIRQSKLPNPSELGNSGSFFKNPIVENEKFKELKLNYPNIVAYPAGEKHTKLAAGWLIEQCGYKGKRYGDTGSHKHQALVLVNYGNAKGKDIWNLALKIQASVKAKFDVDIQPEVNII